jgi:hypothetical protein
VRSVGLGPLVTVLVAAFALLAVTKHRHTPVAIALPKPAPSAAPTQSTSPQAGKKRVGAAAPNRHVPRFFTGTLVGITTGVILGVTAVALITIANPEVRSAVIVGVVLPTPTPTTDGAYIARILVQDMNPNLAYADPQEVAALLAKQPEPEEIAPVLVPVQKELRDNAAVVFLVLGTLTLASWWLIMSGLGSATRGIGEAVVE